MHKTGNSLSQSKSRSIKLADVLFFSSLLIAVGIWIQTRTLTTEQPMAQEMPSKVVAGDERELYLTPGGMYSQSDIEANSNLTPSQKFIGFQAKHDFNPRTGDAICPVTRTKANPQCDWIIGGRRYQFCCPPCIDEFVALAKDRPELIRPPEAYIQ